MVEKKRRVQSQASRVKSQDNCGYKFSVICNLLSTAFLGLVLL